MLIIIYGGSIIQEIKLNNKVIGYVEEAKDILKYLPNKIPDKFKMLGGIDRELLYGEDLYVITKSDKIVGIEINDICPLCKDGIIEDIGGCSTCTRCNFQTHCGL